MGDSRNEPIDLNRGLVALQQLREQGLTNDDLLFIAASPLLALTVVDTLHAAIQSFGIEVETLTGMRKPNEQERERLRLLIFQLKEVYVRDFGICGVRGVGRICYEVLLMPKTDVEYSGLLPNSAITGMRDITPKPRKLSFSA